MKTNQQGPLCGLCRFNPEAATEIILVFFTFLGGQAPPHLSTRTKLRDAQVKE